jgi:hypothetical protein
MEGIELAFEQLRSLEEALSDLRETYKQAPSRFLARMIANAEAEIADRATQNRSSDATLSCSRPAITPEPASRRAPSRRARYRRRAPSRSG